MTKQQMTIRLSDEALAALEETQRLMGTDKSATIDVALRHLRGTVRREQPLYLNASRWGAAAESA